MREGEAKGEQDRHNKAVEHIVLTCKDQEGNTKC